MKEYIAHRNAVDEGWRKRRRRMAELLEEVRRDSVRRNGR